MFKNASLALLDRDKLLLAFLMATKMIENRSDLELNELKVFCVGISSLNNMNDIKD